MEPQTFVAGLKSYGPNKMRALFAVLLISGVNISTLAGFDVDIKCPPSCLFSCPPMVAPYTMYGNRNKMSDFIVNF
jgi:hypothetical protein